MKHLISFVFACLLGGSVWAASPVKLVAKTGEDWQQPVYDASGSYLAFTNASQTEIWFRDRASGATRPVVKAQKPGRRFCFEPGHNRLLFRQASMADPNRSERMLSTDLWTYDPVPRTTNVGPSNGPYVIEDKLWYRSSLSGPLLDVSNKPRTAAPYLDPTSGACWVINAAGDTVYRSTPAEKIAGMETSPDGKWVALVSAQPIINLSLVWIADGTVQRISKAGNPGWSGDSQTVAYTVFADNGRSSAIRLWRAATGNTESVPLPPSCYPSDPALSFHATLLAYISDGELFELSLGP
ncbi:hypothetical protein HZB60_00645 [candidate division KSB1 bacterium]|nr:hypothetical protein [candidate division KSB1 bacterium]